MASWKNAALAAVLSAHSATGQQVIFIPMHTATGPRPVVGSTPRSLESLLSGEPPLHNSNIPPAPSGEPPCRQRRLEPWRRAVREACRAEAVDHCGLAEGGGGGRRASAAADLFQPSSYITWMSSSSSSSSSSSLMSLAQEMDAFFSEFFETQSSDDVATAISGDSGDNAEEEEDGVAAAVEEDTKEEEGDPIEKLLTEMMGFSLRAFDQMMMESASGASPSKTLVTVTFVDNEEEEGGEPDAMEEKEEEEELHEETLPLLHQHQLDLTWSEDEFEDDDAVEFMYSGEGEADDDMIYNRDLTEYEDDDDNEERRMAPRIPRMSPEEAAESALDAMVAALARSIAVPPVPTNSMSDEAESSERRNLFPTSIAEEEDAGNDVETNDGLQRRLSRFGNGVLAETSTMRRRLTEGDAAAVNVEDDPRLRIKERLGRRLTEYASDLFLAPGGSDGVVTLYTSTNPKMFGAPPPPPPSFDILFGGPPSFGGVIGGPPPIFAMQENGMMNPSFAPPGEAPLGGVVTLYTSTNPKMFGAPPPPPSGVDILFGGPPSFGGLMMNPSFAPPGEAPLGMGSRELDRCILARFEEDALDDSTECRRSVGEFLLAVDKFHPQSPHFAEFGDRILSEGPSPPKSTSSSQGYLIVGRVTESLSDMGEEEGGRGGVLRHVLCFATLFIIVYMIMEQLCVYDDDEEEEDEEYEREGGDANIEFDYAALPEDGEDGDRVFMGVPVQVV
eukprot:CAMPEP_0183742638 /NCGR_PEP_ID=MMETSP0737-20130205/64802_1 /TAXON_ID=385413 /ORGANISM="Thalassiosira miniscula, Strain CCMP1093" /LENGTH=729 /DNA_ID=CAMNT_0025978227 /DNA_START=81 /DNA_END=2269 /DNA_ORIENTATION=-